MDLSSELTSHFNNFRTSANSFLSQYEPLALLLAPLLSLLLANIIRSFFHLFNEKGLKATLIGFFMTSVKLIPAVKSYIDAEKQKVVDKMQSDGKSKRDGWNTELPSTGLGISVLEKMREEKRKDVAWQGKCSGTVYIGGSEYNGHFAVINEACSMFAHTNPLHLDVFKSIGRFEAEVVVMTAALLGSKEKTSGGQICGNMTSGGTENSTKDESEDFKACFEYLSHKSSNGEDQGTVVKDTGKEKKGATSKSAEKENCSDEITDELRRLKGEYEKLALEKDSEVLALLAEKKFVWNQLKIKQDEVEKAN